MLSKKKLTVSFVVFIFFFSLINQVFSSNVIANNFTSSEDSDNPRVGLIGRILQKIGEIFTGIAPIFRLVVMSVAAVPPFIEIGYNETVNIDLGMLDIKTNDFIVWIKETPLFAARYITFDVVEYPGGTNPSYWYINFEPISINVKAGVTLKTNVTISLIAPPISTNAIQSGMLKIKITNIIAWGNLWTPPKGTPLNKFPNRAIWILDAVFLKKFGKYSGTVDSNSREIDILVKVKPFHYLKIDTLPLFRLNPDQITSIPITLENLGNYNDTFSFRATGKNKNIKISNPPSITLAPGESKDIYLGISVPQSAFDYGTLHRVNIEAYSIHDPNVIIAERIINIETRGLYISEMGGIGFLFLIIIIFLGIAFYVHRRRLFYENYCIKPDKPWNIPEEWENLEKIKGKDKKEYNETLEMMQDEYKSALLWHKFYCKNIIEVKLAKEKEEKIKKEEKKKEKIKKEKIKKEKREKKVKEEKIEVKKEDKKPVKKEEIKEEKPIKPKKTEQEILIEKKAKAEKRKREIILSRVKKQENKQKKKFGRGG